MILISFNFFLFLTLIFFHGYIFQKKLLKVSNRNSFYETGLIGLIITLLISKIINFFVPLNNNILYVNVIFLFLYESLYQTSIKTYIGLVRLFSIKVF